jgi:prepilin-type processing-associated H-X9-DG protein
VAEQWETSEAGLSQEVGKPPIANDQRHPGGIETAFFDGHVRTMDLERMDPGYPNELSKRLRFFTVRDSWP